MNELSKKYWTDDPELLEKYILGNLTEDERKKFDAEIADCEACKEKLRREKLIVKGIRYAGREAMKLKLKRQILRQKSWQIRQYSIAGLAAAVVIIAAGVGVYSIWWSDIHFSQKFSKRAITVNAAPPEDSAVKSSEAGSETSSPAPEELKIAEGDTDARNSGSSTGEGAGDISRRPRSDSGKKRKVKGLSPAKTIPAASAPVKPFSQKVWLIGTVVMLSNSGEGVQDLPSSQGYLKEQSKPPKRETKNDGRNSKSFSIQISDKTQTITIERRALYELPSSRRTSLAAKTHIETFVERNERGLFMTLYNDKVRGSDIDNASVSISSGDSLIVSLPDQQIVYRLPPSWNIGQPSLRR